MESGEKEHVESSLENRGEWNMESYEKDRDARCAHERKVALSSSRENSD